MLAGIAFFVILLGGIAISLPAYARLLRYLEADHPDIFERLRRPKLIMLSPSRGIALQGFVYRDSRGPGISPRVAKLCRFLGIFVPIFVLTIFAANAWLCWAFIAYAQHANH